MASRGTWHGTSWVHLFLRWHGPDSEIVPPSHLVYGSKVFLIAQAFLLVSKHPVVTQWVAIHQVINCIDLMGMGVPSQVLGACHPTTLHQKFRHTNFFFREWKLTHKSCFPHGQTKVQVYLWLVFNQLFSSVRIVPTIVTFSNQQIDFSKDKTKKINK